MIVNRAAARCFICLSTMLAVTGCTGSVQPPAGIDSVSVSMSATTSSTNSPLDRGPVLSVDALPFPAPSGAALPSAAQQAIQSALDRVVHDSSVIHGITAAVVSPTGSWAGAAGVDGTATPLTADSMMDIASITKTVTAAEILSLEQAGLVNLEAPASQYLDHPLLARNPTVRQLLSHTSGVPEYITDAFVTDIQADPTRSWTAGQALGYATEPITDPGSPVMTYSNSNYLLLGLLIEKITGLDYPHAFRRDVLTGSGPRMVVQDAEPPVPPLAAPGKSRAGQPDAVPDGAFLPNRAWASAAGAAGGIAADAPTLADWGYRLYGGRILPPTRTVELATEVAPGYGLGTVIQEQQWGPNGGAVGHDGSIPGYQTLLTVLPADQLSIAVLVDGTASPSVGAVIREIVATMRP
jgi:D-alanyl-D-alanine carboxypeptidase